ncbi:hypothetical protein CDD81_4847 [Ophiocordyceps australis]|uniref:Uncharacterized protein n=1 Tax=Ophiocordyceps australis TaxID=1399860 RepID=A0A2C5Y9D3_9HYPO|nr:hypothetical protein CDD81_4847 [Ophiocordyceps australis]
MARFVDLEQENDDASAPCIADAVQRAIQKEAISLAHRPHEPPKAPREQKQVRSAMIDALSCYPIVKAIVASIDLNTLDALARTCRSVHSVLIQYRSILLVSTLRCSRDAAPTNCQEPFRYRARASNWSCIDNQAGCHAKASDCARDMVSECRKCGDVICRNCAIKPPAPATLRERHRRLCVACARAPIAMLVNPALERNTLPSSDIVQQAVCKCDTSGVWLCQPCGRNIRGADHEYRRIWRWRNTYGEILGGLGTGIGDGDRGVVCGREQYCLGARERENETDCDAEDARDTGTAPWISEQQYHPPSPATPSPPSTAASPFTSLMDELRHEHERTPSPQLGPGYERHEIEGIGGRVKRKLVRMVRVGACVPEWDDEMNGRSGILEPELQGNARSWCGWCWRVIPGRKDLECHDSSLARKA